MPHYLTSNNHVDYAVTARTKCKFCNEAIHKGELRVCARSMMGSWNAHVSCVVLNPKHASAIKMVDVTGFNAVSAPHRELLLAAERGDLKEQQHLRGSLFDPRLEAAAVAKAPAQAAAPAAAPAAPTGGKAKVPKKVKKEAVPAARKKTAVPASSGKGVRK